MHSVFEINLFYSLYHLAYQNQIFDNIVIFVSNTLGVLVLFSVVLFLFLHDHPRKGFEHIFVVLGGVFFSFLVAGGLKSLLYSPRPFAFLQDVRQMFDVGHVYGSFPSGHTVFFVSLAVAIYMYHKKFGAILLVLAVCIGIARIIAGVHWPLDILGGMIIGAIIPTLFFFFMQRILRKHTD